jgi:hypothetical protein
MCYYPYATIERANKTSTSTLHKPPFPNIHLEAHVNHLFSNGDQMHLLLHQYKNEKHTNSNHDNIISRYLKVIVLVELKLLIDTWNGGGNFIKEIFDWIWKQILELEIGIHISLWKESLNLYCVCVCVNN